MDRTAIKNKLAEIVEHNVGELTCAIEETTNLQTDLSLDSVDVVTLAIEIQSEFRIDLRSEELMKIVVVKDLIDVIEAKVAAKQAKAA
jgi:acyl carrier protein